MHGIDCSACCYGGMDLAEVLLGFVKQLFGFAVIRSVLAFFCKRLGVRDEIEVAEALFALTCEVNGHHRGNFAMLVAYWA